MLSEREARDKNTLCYILIYFDLLNFPAKCVFFNHLTHREEIVENTYTLFSEIELHMRAELSSYSSSSSPLSTHFAPINFHIGFN